MMCRPVPGIGDHSLRGHLPIFGDIEIFLVIIILEKWYSTGVWWDTGKYSTMNRTASYTKSYLDQNVNRAKVENPASE